MTLKLKKPQDSHQDLPDVSQLVAFERQLVLDKNALDEAACRQAELYYHVAREAALAFSLKDSAKEQLIRIDAELSSKYRKEMEHSGTRPTDSRVNDAVLGDLRHRTAADLVNTLALKAAQWFALQTAFEQRSRMLVKLADMFQSGYWSDRGADTASTSGLARQGYLRQRDAVKKARR